MKNTIKLKNAAFYTLLAASLCIGISSCSNSSKQEDTKDVAEEHNDAKFDENKNEKDAQFLVNAAEINLMEIDLGKLASEKGTSAEVKELGQMMADAHTKAMEELKTLSAQKMITIPASATDEGKKKYEDLAKKSGSDFDKEYCDMMVNGHKDAIDRFEKAVENCSDADIKSWASNTLPTLRNHLDHAITCQNNTKKM